ncbi:prephenate dehydratase [Parabacteroides sp. FAFU027]|uniref:prephenate dehydratase n=1 Tax=Parabacteroides sp. FAFU027 TaxID=2922715 RepID=UPI001FAEFCE8|nr:prephenate dehydratase [Parabacteroides sp. FAFU027]
MKKVAIQGFAGSYHEVASRAYFKGEELEFVFCKTFKDVFAATKSDPKMFAAVAIENTIAGSLLPNYDLLKESNLSIIGEYKLHISHCLCALPGTTLEELTEINSHPIALMQCHDFLDTLPNVKVVEKADTALSAEIIARDKLVGVGAICSRLAADLFGLEVLKMGVETNKRNFTRFLMLADQWVADEITKGQTPNKSSLVFTLPHTEGSLSQVLSILSFYGVNLTKIQSLPIIGREWEYQFYIDLTYNDYTRYRQAMDACRPLTKDLKVLGEYCEAETP